MIILGSTLPDLDVADLETAQKIDDFYSRYTTAGDAVVNEQNRVAIIKTVCSAVFEGFDELFGAGAAKQVFGDKTNLRECAEAVKQLTITINQAQNDLTAELQQIPKEVGNRAMRRAAAKGKK